MVNTVQLKAISVQVHDGYIQENSVCVCLDNPVDWLVVIQWSQLINSDLSSPFFYCFSTFKRLKNNFAEIDKLMPRNFLLS